MTPSPETLAVLLALPPEARRALCEAEGPGWLVSRWQTERSVEVKAAPYGIDIYPDAPHADTAWLPASEGEVLRVWAAAAGWRGYAVNDALVSIGGGAESRKHDNTLDGRLRAALACCPKEAFGGTP